MPVRRDELPNRLQPVVPLLALAANNAEISDSIGVTVHTAEKYVSELKFLLEARDRVELVDLCRALMDA